MTSAPRLRSEKTAIFADTWYAARDAVGGLPRKAEIPLRPIARLMPHIAITQDDEDGMPRYRLFGSGLVSDFGRDLTGEYVFDSMTEEAKAQLFASFEQTADIAGEDGVYGRWNIGMAQTSSGRVVMYEGLTFPYIDQSGQTYHMTYAEVLDLLGLGEGITLRHVEMELEYFDALAERPGWMFLSGRSNQDEI